MTTTISYTENVEEITVSYTESGDVVILKFNEQASGPPGTVGAPGGLREVKSASFTAANDTAYTATATLTVTDPTPAQGEGFSVFVRNGTATVGGVAYSTAGTIIERIYHSGSWSNYVYQVASPYTLPIATGSVLGGIKSSSDIVVDGATGVATVATGNGDGNIPRIFEASGVSYIQIGSSAVNLNNTNGSITTGQNGYIATGEDSYISTENGGYIKTQGDGFINVEGFINTGGGGYINTSSGGGSIDTTDGNIGLGVSGARTTLQKQSTQDRLILFQDADGTIAHLSDIPSISGLQSTSGVLALAGFSSITGTIATSNISGTLAQFQALLGIQAKKSTAQMDVTSSTTYVDITGLTGYALDADTVYEVTFFGQVTCGASGGYKVAINSSAAFFHTASGSHGFGSMNQIGGTTTALFQLDSTNIIINSRTAAGTSAPFMTIFTIRTGASAPTVKFQFAQNASNATTSSLIAGAAGMFKKII